MNIKRIALASVTTSALLVSGLAHATVITGSYSGIATIVSGPYLETTTQPVTGVFSFENDIGTCAPIIYPDQPPCVLPFSWTISAGSAVPEFNYNESIASYIQLSQSANQQQVSLVMEEPHGEVDFTFGSNSHNLFRNYDLSTFNPKAVDVDASHAGFTGMYLDVDVAFNTLSFDGYKSVPEPATGSLLMFGIAGLLLTRRPSFTTRLPARNSK